MAKLKFSNAWGSEGSNLDQQRADLFRVTLNVPVGGNNSWSNDVEFAIEDYPFHDDKVNVFQTKYLQQINQQISGDAEAGSISVKVRYAFSQPTAQLLYNWFYIIRNPLTGGVAITSTVKCSGLFQWLVPDMNVVGNPTNLTGDVLRPGLEYVLEGCLITSLKPDGASMTRNDGVALNFDLHIDRYYPKTLTNMVVNTAASRSGAPFLVSPVV